MSELSPWAQACFIAPGDKWSVPPTRRSSHAHPQDHPHHRRRGRRPRRVAAPAQAEERTCRGALGAITIDNLRVPQDATCTLTRTYVKGTVKVERGATLKADAVRVIGNIQAENHRFVSVRNSSRVDGSLQVKQGGGATVSNSIFGSDVQFFTNAGAISITSNRINGNLQCKENRPAPTGGANIVQGNKEDQCARL